MGKKAEKVKTVDRLTTALSQSSVLFLLDFQGLTVSEVTELRGRLRGLDAKVTVVKNTLAKRAASAAGSQDLEQLLTGPSAVVFCEGDAVAVARSIQQFIREKKKMAVKGGFLQSKVISAPQVEELATLPSREQLVARVVGGLAAPLYGIAIVLNGPVRGLAVALDRIREQKEQAA
ncbi:MAG: 50S ribosomal protein L10 [Gaiellales bacterium]|nr:50S ribosomal protein L10 [Gaiellales bacterium]